MGLKNDQKKKTGLLEALTKEMGVVYLSDLRGTKHKTKCYLSVQGIGEDDYSLSEWKDAAWYLIGKNCTAATSAEVKNWILDHLKG